MSQFAYRDGALHVEDVAIEDIATAVGTPFYCYSSAALVESFEAFRDAVSDLPAMICYAVKANSNLAVLRTLAELGAGADVVSEGELRRALAAGIAPHKIVFSGVGKTRAEMAFALEAEIGQFNVESEPELETLGDVASGMGRTARVAIRVNPDVEVDTHEKIATGSDEHKFGISFAEVARIYRHGAGLEGIEMSGLAVHIGSQLTSVEPFRTAFGRLADLVRTLVHDGLPVRRLDLGGGLGISYDAERPPSPEDYAEVVRATTAELGVELIFEPGRFLVAEAGVMVTRVIYVKSGASRRFVIVDAAMNDLLRPSLYQAHHAIVPVAVAAPDAKREVYDVVGPICETGDVIAADRLLAPVAADDLLAVACAGAYGAVMASSYNSRLLVPEVLVNGDQFAVVRPRQDYQEMLLQDRIPSWLEGQSRTRSSGPA
jgi:diaminopimelate decarboxylase